MKKISFRLSCSVEGKYGNGSGGGGGGGGGIIVRKRSAVMRGLGKSLPEYGCQFETWFTSVVQIGVKEPARYH